MLLTTAVLLFGLMTACRCEPGTLYTTVQLATTGCHVPVNTVVQAVADVLSLEESAVDIRAVARSPPLPRDFTEVKPGRSLHGLLHPEDSSPLTVDSQLDLPAWALAAAKRLSPLLRSQAGTAGTQSAAAQKRAAAGSGDHATAQMAAADALSAGEVLAATGGLGPDTTIDGAARSAVVQQLQSALHLAAATALGLDLDDFDNPAELFEWIRGEAAAIVDRAEADSTALEAAREAERFDTPVQLPEELPEVFLEEEELPFVLKMWRLQQDSSSQSNSAVVGKLQPQQPAPLATDQVMHSSSAANEAIQQASQAQRAQEEATSDVKGEPEGQAALLGQVIAALQDLLWGIQQDPGHLAGADLFSDISALPAAPPSGTQPSAWASYSPLSRQQDSTASASVTELHDSSWALSAGQAASSNAAAATGSLGLQTQPAQALEAAFAAAQGQHHLSVTMELQVTSPAAAQGALRRAILQQYLQLKLDTCGCYAEEASVLFDDERVFSTRHMQQGPHIAQGDTLEDVIDASALTAEAHRPAPAAPSLPPAFYIFFGALACAVAIAGASLLSLALQHRRYVAARHAAAAMHYLPL